MIWAGGGGGFGGLNLYNSRCKDQKMKIMGLNTGEIL